MKKKLFRVGRSRTGLGLFAVAPIRKGRLIVEYRGRRIPTRNAAELDRLKANRYLFEIDKNWTIDGSSRRDLARYANHACRPNTEAEWVRGRMMYRARRKIREGEEITIDYGKEYFDLYLKTIGCRCETCLTRPARMRRKRLQRAPRRRTMAASKTKRTKGKRR